MMRIIGSTKMPCGHHKVTAVEDGKVVRCKDCKKKWTMHVVPASEYVRQMLNEDVRTLAFEALSPMERLTDIQEDVAAEIVEQPKPQPIRRVARGNRYHPSAPAKRKQNKGV